MHRTICSTCIFLLFIWNSSVTFKVQLSITDINIKIILIAELICLFLHPVQIMIFVCNWSVSIHTCCTTATLSYFTSSARKKKKLRHLYAHQSLFSIYLLIRVLPAFVAWLYIKTRRLWPLKLPEMCYITACTCCHCGRTVDNSWFR